MCTCTCTNENGKTKRAGVRVCVQVCGATERSTYYWLNVFRSAERKRGSLNVLTLYTRATRMHGSGSRVVPHLLTHNYTARTRTRTRTHPRVVYTYTRARGALVIRIRQIWLKLSARSSAPICVCVLRTDCRYTAVVRFRGTMCDRGWFVDELYDRPTFTGLALKTWIWNKLLEWRPSWFRETVRMRVYVYTCICSAVRISVK